MLGGNLGVGHANQWASEWAISQTIATTIQLLYSTDVNTTRINLYNFSPFSMSTLDNDLSEIKKMETTSISVIYSVKQKREMLLAPAAYLFFGRQNRCLRSSC